VVSGYILYCHGGATVMFHKRCRMAQSSRTHKTKSMSVMGHVQCVPQGRVRNSSTSLSLSHHSRAWYCKL